MMASWAPCWLPVDLIVRRVAILIAGLLVSHTAASADTASLAAEARSILGANQGVYIETTNGTALLSQEAGKAVHPASVSKVPTTLALLRKLGADYRFVTTFSARGAISQGTLHGDLLVESNGDPAFVDENALLVADRLRELGITQVTGQLRLRGNLTFDWQGDDDGSKLQRALAGSVSPAALAAVRAFELGNPTGPTPEKLLPSGIRFLGGAEPTPTSNPTPASMLVRPLLVHRSQPLLPLAKSLNDYSNNIFKPLADAAGGAAAVEALARSAVPGPMQSEIKLGDGAGTDPINRLSPRAAVKLLRALEEELKKSGHVLTDILPVCGIDEGTLRRRLDGPDEVGRVVGKTGTYGDYGASALVGAIPTSDRGTVYFAILNHGVPVPEARRRQDRFVRALLQHLASVPWNYQRDVRPAIARAEVTAPK
jgi:D-alanyl-D-alanine carboxypeptidase/D-alanyl-D-alanine-endopeptidase (penicillin-binding protein 4)